MNILRNIEKSITGHIEDRANINLDKTNNMIKKYFEHKLEIENVENEKYNKYMSLFENERIKNNIEYDLYVKQRNELRNIWEISKTKGALHDMLKFPKPEMKEIPDIYSYSILQIKDTRTPIISNKPPAKPVKDKPNKPPAKPVKDKPNKPPAKPVKDKPNKPPAKQAEKPPKECPEGKILNPKTGRCINDPQLKKKK